MIVSLDVARPYMCKIWVVYDFAKKERAENSEWLNQKHGAVRFMLLFTL